MYTVRQLSILAGITSRTLHYYDEIGLLKPVRVGDNGYRYYAEESLLRLQQILLYRELDMPLEQIKNILEQHDFDVFRALEQHKVHLRKRITHLERMIATVDHTISHLRGEREMSEKQLFEAFSEEQQAEYEKEALELYDPDIVKASNKRWKNYSTAEKQRIQDEGNAVYQGFLVAIPKGPSSPEAQESVVRWRQHMDYFWTPDDEQLLGLANGYNDEPRFKQTFDKIDPNLAEFIRQAVLVYLGKE